MICFVANVYKFDRHKYIKAAQFADVFAERKTIDVVIRIQNNLFTIILSL